MAELSMERISFQIVAISTASLRDLISLLAHIKRRNISATLSERSLQKKLSQPAFSDKNDLRV